MAARARPAATASFPNFRALHKKARAVRLSGPLPSRPRLLALPPYVTRKPHARSEIQFPTLLSLSHALISQNNLLTQGQKQKNRERREVNRLKGCVSVGSAVARDAVVGALRPPSVVWEVPLRNHSPDVIHPAPSNPTSTFPCHGAEGLEEEGGQELNYRGGGAAVGGQVESLASFVSSENRNRRDSRTTPPNLSASLQLTACLVTQVHSSPTPSHLPSHYPTGAALVAFD